VSIAPRDPHEPITDEQWEQIRAAWPDRERLRVAWALARDVDALSDLLAGRTVHTSRLKPEALAKAREESLVQLRSPLSLLSGGRYSETMEVA
jgi:hypothetical protein